MRFGAYNPVVPSAEILFTHTPALFATAVERAAVRLRAGEIVALPTETVYGLAGNALDAAVVAKIYVAKGRPAHNPVIVHVGSRAMARECSSAWPELADRLADAFWPGPLTLIVPRAAHIPDIVTAGGPTVGVRWPLHPLMPAVIRACGFPLAAPSANLSDQLSPTNAAHVAKQLGDRIPLIVDGGDSNVGIESTVVDVTADVPRVLRPGMISAEAIAAVCGGVVPGAGSKVQGPGEGTLRSPGLLAKHYSPKAKLLILSWRDEADLLTQLKTLDAGPGTRDCGPGSTHVLAHKHIPLGGKFAHVSVIPHDAEAFARGLYGELHRCDDGGAKLIVVEALPETSEWAGIADRLRRAAA
ncbi:MAG TPA: L-threonylcarbamoyladenylate synthase [Candidatus Limnocylindria bacterium]|nr:L-threonylcarbamoyladenylate synthase [Candidatus Limnocylindria bacterium]